MRHVLGFLMDLFWLAIILAVIARSIGFADLSWWLLALGSIPITLFLLATVAIALIIDLLGYFSRLRQR